MPRRLLTLCLAALALGLPGAAGGADTRTVAVTAIIEHPALDATRRGIEDALAAAGYRAGENLELIFASAQGSLAMADRIAQDFVAAAPDVIVPISTPSAQAVAAATTTIAVVFTAVTDPIGAGLVAQLARPGGNVTGMSDLSPVGEQLDLIKAIVPGVARLGVIYNPGEANSRSLFDLVEKAGAARDLVIVPATVRARDGVGTAATGLVGNADAIYVPTDNTVVAELEAVVAAGRKGGLPVFAADIEAVPRGAVAAIGFNYYDLGRQTGRMVVRVLEGEAPGTIPVANVAGTELFVNLEAAEAMAVSIPDAVIARAKTVIEAGWSPPETGAGAVQAE